MQFIAYCYFFSAQICTCKSYNIKHVWNTKTSQYHITATPHYYRKTFCSYGYILIVHFTISTIWGLQKLRLVGMVSYHYTFLIFKYMFLTPPKNCNEVVSVGPILILAVVICSNIYNICKSEWHFAKLPRWATPMFLNPRGWTTPMFFSPHGCLSLIIKTPLNQIFQDTYLATTTVIW